MKIINFISLILFFCLPLMAQSPSPLVFTPQIVNIGDLQQGAKVKVTLQGKNTAATRFSIESVMSQNSGPTDFKYPKEIGPNQAFTVEYTLNSAYMEGSFNHTIVVIEANGKPHLAYASGNVQAPIWFSEKIFDLGYYTPGTAIEWTFYAWNPNFKSMQLALSPESAKEFSTTIAPVKLHVDKLDAITEGGNVPGLKITLKPKNLGTNTGKSIRKIVSFQSPTFPLATPDVQVIGYWK